jgi:hypothetical protein
LTNLKKDDIRVHLVFAAFSINIFFKDSLKNNTCWILEGEKLATRLNGELYGVNSVWIHGGDLFAVNGHWTRQRRVRYSSTAFRAQIKKNVLSFCNPLD